jgi:hypothetical protein
MPTDGTGTGNGGQGRLLDDPRLLAAGAAGLASAVLALSAFHALPFGTVAFWLTPLPLFLAGMGFGTLAAFGALAVAALALWLAASAAGLWLFLVGFGIPALLLVAAAGQAGLGRPLALLGILPAAGIAAAAWWLSDAPGGLEGMLHAMAKSALRRFDLAASAGMVADIVRVKAAALGFWLAVAMLANAWAAGRLLARAGIAAPPAWSGARLPGWYVVLPALAFGWWLAADSESDAVELSLLLVLLVPLMLHGLAALHSAMRGRGERRLVLGAVYLSLVLLFLPASFAVAGYGAFDLLTRRSPSNSGGARTAPPRS